MAEKILIVDDEKIIRESLAFVLRNENYEVDEAEDGLTAFQLLKKNFYDLIITDLEMPNMKGIDLLEKIKQLNIQIPVIIITAFGSLNTAISALRNGASDYILKPIEFDEITFRVKQLFLKKDLIVDNKILRNQINSHFNLDNMIGESEAMREVFSLIKRVSNSNTTVLITGETGTGKELAARSIHQNSERREKPFIPVNCGAIPENLYESEFFGYKKGAFTGAVSDHDGLFKSADKGTLFLDEIADLPEHVQVKLLRVLQEKEIKPLGSDKFLKVDVRIIAATNKDLKKEVEEKRFRDDLYYRINIIEIKMPKLSERKEDIPLLVDFFIKKYNKELKKHIKGIDNKAMQAFMNYNWEGNLRELENMIERLILLNENNEIITIKDFPSYMKEKTGVHEDYDDELSKALESYEKQHIINILKKTKGNRSESAKLLKIDVSTLYRKMLRYNINDFEYEK